MTRLSAHWPEYVSEALCLALFMISAAAVATLLQHPSSPFSGWSSQPVLQRVPMGIAMGLTCIALIYSPLGARSGAHMNPAVTLTFLRLGKIARVDAWAYVAAQFVGGATGIVVATLALGGLPAHPAVNYVATLPGPAGAAAAFAAEMVISFLMMAVVLAMSNTPGLARYTGVGAGVLVAAYITFEAPISGMSMNPARTFGSNVLTATFSSLWIYFTAPVIGMLLAGESYSRRLGRARVRCAKLHHPRTGLCIFACGHKERSA